MNSMAPVLEWLRGWHRGYKFAVLLVAAWAPFLFPKSPILTGVVMSVMTTLFFIITRPSTEVRDGKSSPAGETQDAKL